MAVTVEVLAAYVGLDWGAATPQEQTDIERCLSAASARIDYELSFAIRDVEEADRDQCVLDVGLAYWQRTQTNDGQYDGGSPHGPLDPLMRVRPILQSYVMYV